MKRGLIVALAVVSAGRAAAQGDGRGHRWTVSGSISTLFARQAVRGAGDTGQTGTWIGAGIEGSWHGVALLIRGHSGTLGPTLDSTDRRVRATDVALRTSPRPGLVLGVEAEALRFAGPDSTAVWRLAGPTLGISAGLGVDGLSAGAEGAYFPVHGVANDDPLSSALRLEVGLTYAPLRLPVSFGLAFRRQTFNFGDGRAPETLGGLVLSARARLLPR
jgi:hypothetical protein